MKRSKSPARHKQPAVEPLESRIAPAGVTRPTFADIGDTTSTKDVEYDDGPKGAKPGFVNMATAVNDPIADAIGHLPDTYYMKLAPGQGIDVYNGSAGKILNYAVVSTGHVVAIFHDANHDNNFEIGELEGFAISDGTTLTFKDKLQGDIVENLSKDGKTMNATTLSTGAGVNNLTFLSGDVAGKLLIGSNLKKATFKGIDGIYAGSAAGGQAYDFFPDIAGITGTITPFTPAAGVKGISITNLTIDTIGAVQSIPFIINHPAGTIQAGSGGPGAAGGALTNIQVLQDGNGFNLYAGNGGNSDSAAGKLNAGPGGALSGIYVAGINDLDTPGHPTQNSPIEIKAGNGGIGDTGLGGKGGAASNVWVGFRKIGPGAPAPTSNFLHDNVVLTAGDGGNGETAGAGGAVSLVRFNLNTTGDKVAYNPADPFHTSEIVVKAGNGGSTVGAKLLKAGLGGKVSDVQINNLVQQDLVDPSGPIGQLTFLPNADIQVAAGDAGLSNGGSGANGGAVSTVKILGSNIFINAGDGSSGTHGGIGGAISGLTIRQDGNIFARSGEVNAGIGGDSTAGAGAPGGNISGFVVEDSDLGKTGLNPGTVFSINAGSAANGGDGLNGLGGKGGSVTGLQLFERDAREGQAPSTRLSGKIEIRTGIGGDGLKGGGPGGAFDNTTIATVGTDLGITVGNGGNALSTGKANGGAGGRINRLDITAAGNAVPDPLNVTQLLELTNTVTVVSGTGGNGGTAAGNVSRGGAGGAVMKANINSSGSASLTAGDGGNGGLGAAGVGASITVSGVFARGGDGTMIAGDAGVGGAKPAAGGSVKGTDNVNLSGVFGTANVTLHAGDGSHGGAGGSLLFIGYGEASQALLPTPAGNITIKAGDGSAEGAIAGAGGQVNNISGSVSSGFGSLTSITAGQGGGSALASAAGGSVFNVLIQRGPSDIVDPHTGVIDPVGTLTIQAGDAGNAGVPAGGVTAGKGASGGSVSQVTVLEIGQGTNFRSIVAGDGGTGATTGGTGGSVTEVHVLNHDIGVKTGQPFGIATMGGIFAGAKGHGTTDGKAGSVSGITADSISAIAAGKTASPDLAERVERITLNAGPVLPPALSTSATAEFQLTYHPVMEYRVVASAGGNPQSQEFTRLLGGTGSSQQPGGGPTTFTLSYGTGANKITTAPIDANASPAQIQQALANAGLTTSVINTSATTFEVDFLNTNTNGPITGLGTETTQVLAGNTVPAKVRAALNQLPNIDDKITNDGKFDGVDVITTPTSNYQITFRNPGDAGDITAERLLPGVTTVPIIGDATHAELQNVDVVGVGAFTLSYGSGAFNSTVRLPAGATPAQVENALNNLPNIAFDGGVTVTQGVNGSYDIHFNSAGPTTALVKATEFSSVTTATLRPGAFNTVETVKGDSMHAEQQFYIPTSSGSYQLSYQGETSPDTLASNSTAADVKTALNKISTIAAQGSVDVSGDFQNGFTISFQQGGFDADPITIQQSEQQTVNLPLLRYGNPNGLVFQVIDTSGATPVVSEVTVPGDATAAQVESQLNSLPVIAAHQGVTVKLTADNTFSISFKSPADQTGLVLNAFEQLPTTVSEVIGGANTTPTPIFTVQDGDNATLPEIQEYVPPTVGTYKLTLRATAGDPVDATNTTIALPANALPSDVKAALDAVPSVFAAGGVQSVVLNNGQYVINFNNTANQAPFEISYQAQEVQRVDVNGLGSSASTQVGFTSAETIHGDATTKEVQTITPATSGTPFTLSFNGQTTGIVPENATAAQVQTALNAVSTITAAGGVTVTGNATNGYAVTFANPGDEPELTGHNLGAFTLTSPSVAFTATETTPGDAATHEVQNFTPANTVTPFTLTFNGQTTSAVPENAAASDVQTALNGIQTIKDAGGVTVTGDATSGYAVTFGAMANEPNLTGQNVTHPLSSSSTAADVQAQLNQLLGSGAAQVQSVTGGPNGVFDVTFANLVNQPSLVAVETLPLNPLASAAGTVKLQVPHLTTFTDAEYRASHIVGAIADYNELGSDIFKFIDTNHDGKFTLGDGSGDVPVDGLIAARIFNQNAPTNFTPQARYIQNTVDPSGKIVPVAPGAELFDFHNVI